MFDFRTPLFLALLVVLPVLILMQRRARLSTAKWRRQATLCLRGAALLCAILALANLHRTEKEQRLALLFLVDASESIHPRQYAAVQETVRAAVAGLKPTDTFGVLSFAGETAVVAAVRQKQDQPVPTVSIETLTAAPIPRDATDLLAALKRASVLFPDNTHKRLVIFSDGAHTGGRAPLTDYLPLLSAHRIEILTHPLSPVNDAVRVVALEMPSRVRKGQSFEIRAVIETDGSLPTLAATLYADDSPIRAFEWELRRGIHPIDVATAQPLEAGTRRYTLRLNVTDEIPENNQGHGSVTVQDKPYILYVAGDADSTHTAPFARLLEENGFVVDTVSPAGLPTELVELQRNHAVILNNVSADRLSQEQLASIETYVRDLGHGLVVIGGNKGYGPGGYADTALARALPVEMTPQARKESVAIAFVLDTSGSMANYVGTRQKIGLAIEGVRTGIRNLHAEDVAGIVSFNVDVHTLSELTADHARLRQTVSRLRPTGGTTQLAAAIERGRDMLTADDAERKHIVLLSDGKSDGTASGLLNLAEQLADAEIGITTIAIGDADQKHLTAFSERAGGRVVFVANVQQLPAILTEAVRETQRYIVQETFPPVVTERGTLLSGIGTPPPLHGYVATSEKETAHVFIRSHKGAPILASWNFGLGRAIAWTSDIQSAWARDWIPWHDFGKFWGQITDWVLPATDTGSDVDLRVAIHHGVASVTIDTRTATAAAFTAHVVRPDRESAAIDLQQITPTRYTGSFQMQESGSYIVTALREGGTQRYVETVSLAYPAEYAAFRVDTDLLQRLAAETGGIYTPTPAQIAAPAGVPIETEASLVRVLLVIAVVLFVLEMVLRRFSITNRYVTSLLARFRETEAGPVSSASVEGSVPSPREEVASEASMARLLAAKRRLE